MPPTSETRRAAAGPLGLSCGEADNPQNTPSPYLYQAANNPWRRYSTAQPGVDFGAVNRAALRALPAILNRLAPGGKVSGCEYTARNPARFDRHPGSFKINLRTGRWADFATGDKGGDPVSLVAYLEGVSQGEAARLLGRMLNFDGRGAR